MIYPRLLVPAWLAGSLLLLGGCSTDRGGSDAGLSSAPPSQTNRLVEPSRSGNSNQTPTTDEGAPQQKEDREQRYRQAVLREVIDNAKLGRLIKRKPMLGGTWRVGSAEEVHFLGAGKVALDYEDGHAAGRLVVHVKDPHDLSTWEVLRDEPE